MALTIKNVTVIGLGTLGAQIALLTAAGGYNVTCYDTVENAVGKYLAKLPDPEQQDPSKVLFDTRPWFAAADAIKQVESLAQAVAEADLVIEAVPENLDLKLKVWAELDAAAPAHAILATNSSSMPVSKLEGAIKRKDKCINMHFYQPVFGNNMADLMGGSQTNPEAMAAGRQFLVSVGMVPLGVKKELLGFCFNRVWRAIKKEVLHMWANDFVDFRDVDRAWMIFNHTPHGPFALMDQVGLDVVYDIEMVYYNESQDVKDHPPQALKDKVAAGELGVKTGKGFYDYPDPEYKRDDFLKP